MIVAALPALAEPTRLEAMRSLADGSEHGVCEVMRDLGPTQSRLSRHMRVPKPARRVVERRDAQVGRYRTNPELRWTHARLADAALERQIKTAGPAA